MVLGSPAHSVTFASDLVAVGQESGDVTLVDARFGEIVGTIRAETQSPNKINGLCLRGTHLIAISAANVMKIKFHGAVPEIIAKVPLNGGTHLFCGTDHAFVTTTRGFRFVQLQAAQNCCLKEKKRKRKRNKERKKERERERNMQLHRTLTINQPSPYFASISLTAL